MELYGRLLTELKENAEPQYAAFHGRLLHNPGIRLLGVRVPTLRKIAKKYAGNIEELFALPDEYYEVTFVKLSAAALLPYDKFIKILDRCVPLIDNWATCDCFKAKCIARHKDEFLPFVEAYMGVNKEFYQRFALTTLLGFYVEDKYLNVIFESLKMTNTEFYYAHMAAAWLLAEVLVKRYEEGVGFLKLGCLDNKTHNKAVQKACESFRLTNEQKEYLKTLKR